MTEGDEKLSLCNESELLWLARRQGLPVLRYGIPREELLAIVSGEARVEERHLSPTNQTRARLEAFVQANFDRVQGQLPGCTGLCRTFHCTEGKHMHCFIPNESMLLCHE
jgi:hypothetical protein